MRSLCLFASYVQGDELPYYVGVYLKELKKHFNEVYFLSSQNHLSHETTRFLKEEQIAYFLEKNEGYDFGLWYKAFQKLDVDSFEQVVLVNDSCILFKPLDSFVAWLKSDDADVQGMTFSEAIAPHLQSYFLVFNKKVISTVKKYFAQHKILSPISEVIKTYEVGLSTHLLQGGYKLNAFMSKQGSKSEFSPYYTQVKEHLQQGIPLIKKKILFATYRKDELLTLARMNFDVNTETYYTLMGQQAPLLLSLSTLKEDNKAGMSPLTKVRYRFLRGLIQIYRKFRYEK